MQEFDLAKYAGPEVIALSGRPKGEEIRKRLNLDSVDAHSDKIIVIVPQNIVSLNSSFFLGLFARSVEALGLQGFKAKYSFNARKEVFKDIDEGMEQALNRANPLKPINR